MTPRERARRLATIPEQISIYGAVLMVAIGIMIGLTIGGMVTRATR